VNNSQPLPSQCSSDRAKTKIKKVSLELGGKISIDNFFADADLDKAVRLVVNVL